VVLVSLAVIFLPMLLDGGERGGMPLFGSNIPDKPDYQFQPLNIPLDPVAPVAGDKPQLIDKPEPAPVKPKPQVKEAAKPASPAPASKPESKPLVVKAETPPVAPPAAEKNAAAWVVQVGSFSNSANALKLRNKLRTKGFTAFVEKLSSDGETVYRVRVGPELKRETADALQVKLKERMKLKGIVMGYAP